MTSLRQRVLDELQRRNYSPATTRGYILAIKQPCGFVKIRHYGFLANGVRAHGLELRRSLLPPVVPAANSLTPEQHRAIRRTCPVCGPGRMVVIGIITPNELLAWSKNEEADTS